MARHLTFETVEDKRHSPDTSLVVADGEPLARCSLWWTSAPAWEGKALGIIGHYDAADADASKELLDAACAKLRAAGCAMAVGPMDGSTWRRYRLVTWRGTEPPFFMEPDNPDEWPAHFVAAGFTPIAGYFSAKCDDLAAFRGDDGLEIQHRSAGYAVRELAFDRIDEELHLLWQLATDAFADNFLYSPIGEAEFREMYGAVIPHVRRELVVFLEHRGEPAGFSFAMPDLLQAKRGEPIDTIIHKTMGIRRAHRGCGLGGWLADMAFARAHALGFRRGIHALMHEANPSRKLGRGQVRDIRHYTLYGRAL